MNELDELTRVAPAPEVAELSAGRQAELKAEFLRRVAETPVRRGRTVWRGAGQPRLGARLPGWTSAALRRPVVLVAAVAAVASVAVVTPMALRENVQAGSSSAQQQPPLPAAEVLNRAAAAALATKLVARPDQYLYVEGRNRWGRTEVHGNGTIVQSPPRFNRAEHWMAVAPDKESGWRLNEGEMSPIKPWGAKSEDVNHIPEAELPTDPRKLLAELSRYAAEERLRDFTAFRRITDIQRVPDAPAAVQAALYRAAALIPGIESVGEVTDGLGRPGVAVGFRTEDTRMEWIFSRDGYEYLGSRNVALREDQFGKAGQVRGAEEIVRRAVVDKLGQVP